MKIHKEAGLGYKEFVCGMVVLVLGILGLAKLADCFDRNISKNAVAEIEGQQAPNKNTGNGRRA